MQIQNELSEEGAMNGMTPYIDHEHRSCLLVKKGKKYAYYTCICTSGLRIKRLLISVFDNNFKPYDYPADKMIEKYSKFMKKYGSSEEVSKLLSGVNK
jgi:hypothetical protein